jgi:hypothetical protein
MVSGRQENGLMPVNTVHVHRVDAVATSLSGCVSHLVSTHEGPQFFTLNALRAALCERAIVIGVPVRITWKDGRMKTRDIVAVELEA